MKAIPYVRWAGITIMLPGEASLTRRLYDHEVSYVLAGAGTLIMEGREYSAEADTCHFITPRVVHSSRHEGDEPWVVIGVHFDWNEEPDQENFSSFRADNCQIETDETLFRTPHYIAGWDAKAQPVLDLRGRPLTRHFLEETVTAYTRWDENARDQAGGLLFAALCQIERESRLLAAGVDSSIIGPDAQRRLDDARWLLEQVAEEMPTVAQVAAQVGWSADYLGHMMRSAFGVTPRRLQMDSRLKHARELLRDGVAIAEVARQCGFADTSHLARAFRKDSGLTPREYSSIVARGKTE